MNKPLAQFQMNPTMKQYSCVSTCSLFLSLVEDFSIPFVFCCFLVWTSTQQTRRIYKKKGRWQAAKVLHKNNKNLSRQTPGQDLESF